MLEQNEVKLLFKKVKGKDPLTQKEANEVSVFFESLSQKIIEKWNKVFIFHQKVEFDIVKERIMKHKY